MKPYSTTNAQRKAQPCKPDARPHAITSPKRPKYRFFEGEDGEVYAIAVPGTRVPPVRAACPDRTATSGHPKLAAQGIDCSQVAAGIPLLIKSNASSIAPVATPTEADVVTTQAALALQGQPDSQVDIELLSQSFFAKFAAGQQETNQLLRQLVSLLEQSAVKATQRGPKPRAARTENMPGEASAKYQGKQLLSKAEVCSRIDIRPSTLYAWIAGGKFPKPLKLSAKMSRWNLDDVEAWIAAHQQGPAAMSAKPAKTSA